MYVQQCCYEKQEALASCPQRKSKPTSKYVHATFVHVYVSEQSCYTHLYRGLPSGGWSAAKKGKVPRLAAKGGKAHNLSVRAKRGKLPRPASMHCNHTLPCMLLREAKCPG